MAGDSHQPLSVSRWRARKNRQSSSAASHTNTAGPSYLSPSIRSSKWEPETTVEAELFDDNNYSPSSVASPEAQHTGHGMDSLSSPARAADGSAEEHDFLILQNDRAMSEIARLQAEVAALNNDLSTSVETIDRDKKLLKKLKEDLNESELISFELRQQNDFEKAKNSADKWQAAALEDEVVKLRAQTSNYRKASKQAELNAAKAKVAELHQTLFQHEEKALEYQKKCYELTTQNAMLRASTQAPDWSSQYGERRYEVVAQEGIRYRFSPDLANQNDQEPGPAVGEIVIGIGLLQGPRVIFIKCKSGRGFLPVTDPSGKELLKHTGKVGETSLLY